jgi:hypothetical protein
LETAEEVVFMEDEKVVLTKTDIDLILNILSQISLSVKDTETLLIPVLNKLRKLQNQ